ncbi:MULTISPECIES: YybH family protein [unclassified Nocardioides]|uniref:YybH family protein n=1 Tax=unclassified Nocardioides TaxID=2615069 RepID=UPI0007028B44|nr:MULTISPECIES: nuclear transport factor 2 family protein [unclassified Nocardioides]KRC53118.1 hypothetical protein ASE19_12100 [Nocardioides sp. Root79]KRC72646.1 hypothetical protein ASE20_08625 [Nocardioides sp. Root240]
MKPLTVYPVVTAEDAATFESKVRRFLVDFERGFDAGASWYSRDQRVRIWDGSPVAAPGYDAYAAAARTWLDEEVESLSDIVEDVVVLRDPSGGLAVTIVILRNVGNLRNGERFEYRMRETLVWGRAGDDWRVIHEHTSPLPSPVENSTD